MISRTKTIIILISLCLAAGTGFGAFDSIPRSWQVTIDDTGRKFAANLGAWRDPTTDDYRWIVEIGSNCKARLECLFIMWEHDRDNVIAKPEYNTPVAQYDMMRQVVPVEDVNNRGINWINPAPMGPQDDIEMNYIKDNAAYLGFGLHGVSHDHWFGDGSRCRSEFADNRVTPCDTWGWADTELHLLCWTEIMRQYYDSDTSSFPRCYVPPHHVYYYDAVDPETTGWMLSSYGVKYCNNVFSYMGLAKGLGAVIDNGMMVLERDQPSLPWDCVGCVPTTGNYQDGTKLSVFGTHWPNYWGLTSEWTAYLKGANNSSDRYLAKNMPQAAHQWLYREYTTINDSGGTVTIDNTGMTDEAYTYDLLGNLVLKTALGGQHISSASIDKDAQIVGYWEDEFGYGYLLIGHKTNTMGRLSKDTYTLTYTLSSSYMSTYLDLVDATYNMFSFTNVAADSIETKLEMYGTQDVKIRLTFIPNYVTSDNINLIINSWTYNAPFITINVTGKDIQGEVGTLTISGAAPIPTQVICSADPTTLPADGTSTSQITARICDESGNTMSDQTSQVTFSITSGGGSLQGINPIAASGGIATITYQAGTTEETVTIIATSQGLTQGSVNITLSAQVTPEITVTSPNGGETWQPNNTQTVTWTSQGTVGNVNISLSTDGGSNWTALVSNTSNDGSQTITVPNSPSTSCKIRVQDISGSPSDASNNNFTIEESPDPEAISVDKTELYFSDVEIGSTGTLDFTITNTGGGLLTGSISADKKWIEVQPTSFEGNTVLVNVIADNNILNQPSGQFSGTISITSNGGDTSVEVTLVATCVLVKPNPYDPSKGNLTFFGDGIVMGETTIRIYTLSGELVETLSNGQASLPLRVGATLVARSTEITWDGMNKNGEQVTSGIYIYVYESPKEKGVGKFTIISK